MECDGVCVLVCKRWASPRAPVPPTTTARSACLIERKLKNPEQVRGSGFSRFAPSNPQLASFALHSLVYNHDGGSVGEINDDQPAVRNNPEQIYALGAVTQFVAST